MAFTVIGHFTNTEEAEKAIQNLAAAGFSQNDFFLSKYNVSGVQASEYDFDDDERTAGFWNHLFGENEDRMRHSYAASRSNVVTVYADNQARAEEARNILDDAGAADMDELSKGYRKPAVTGNDEYPISEEKRARILSKARNDVYLLDPERNYNLRNRGEMDSTMDAMGGADRV